MRIFSILFFLFLGLSATPVAAQFSTDSFIDPASSIQLKPEYPQPGEKVTATLSDYNGGSYGANITWVLDGKIIPDAENKREVILTAGKVGETQTLQAVLTRVTGGNEALTTVIKPAYLDIIIEPQTRTPDFYLGRSLPSIGSIVNATALISGNGFRNPDLIYTWRIGQQIIEGGAIRGRNQVSFSTPRGKSEVLSVQVAELDGTIISHRSILLPSVTPEVHFYEVSSLFGMSKKSADAGVSLISNSLVLQAEPYFLDSRTYNDPSVIQWKLGNINTVNPSSNPYEITLQRTGMAGSAELQFHVRDTKQLLQGAQGTTRINF
jgi:hypothetical protein